VISHFFDCARRRIDEILQSLDFDDGKNGIDIEPIETFSVSNLTRVVKIDYIIVSHCVKCSAGHFFGMSNVL
jgi:hypothetical protein